MCMPQILFRILRFVIEMCLLKAETKVDPRKRFNCYQCVCNICAILFVLCSGGVVANELDCDIVVSEFELQLGYCVHFRTNTHGKGIYPPPISKLYISIYMYIFLSLSIYIHICSHTHTHTLTQTPNS